MKINPNFMLTENENGAVIVAKDAKDDKNAINLHSEQAVFLWNYLLQNNCNKEQLLHALLGAYDISTVLALNNIDIFLKKLNEKGILEL